MDLPTPVLRQKCCLTVDAAGATIAGFVEVTVGVTEGQGNINLHARNLKIRSVVWNEAALAWGYKEPSLAPLPEEWKQGKVKDVSADLAKRAFLQYKHIRECTLQSNLCIKLPVDIGAASPKELTLKIAYSVENPVGWAFLDDYAFTRTDRFDGVSCWMPCNAANAKNTVFELEITVPKSQVVICSGTLTTTLPHTNPAFKTFHYKIRGSPGLFATCFGPKGTAASISYTMQFFPSIFHLMEEILQTSAAAWHDCITVSTSLLLGDSSTIDHGLHQRLQVVLGFARIWFGAVVVPKTLMDQWLTEGVVGWLERRIIVRLLGTNELQFRRTQEQRLISAADDGSLPPLCPKNGVPDLTGTEWHHCQELFHWKSTAVMCMIEERVSHEAFKRVIERLTGVAGESCRAGVPSAKRLIASRSFLKEVGQAGGIKKEIQAFAERWVYGRGAPVVSTEVSFDTKTFSLLLSMKQEASASCLESTARAVKLSKDGSIGLVEVSVAEASSTTGHAVQLGADLVREARFKLHGRPRKRRRMEATVNITDNHVSKSCLLFKGDISVCQSRVKWVRVNPSYTLLGVFQTKQTEEMWSAMLEDSKDIGAESEAIHGLLHLESGALSMCRTLQAFIKSTAYCRVRMEAILALAQISGQENAYEGLNFLMQFYRSRRFDPTTSLPRANAFVDLSELLLDQTIPLALGSMRDADGYTPKEAIELILQALEYNNNEGNEFDDSEWIATWLNGLEKAVAKDEAEWKAIFDVIERYLARDSLFPSRQQLVTQACLGAMGAATLRQSVAFREKMMPILAKYVDPEQYLPRTRATAGHAVTQISASIYGPDVAVFNTLCWLLEETSNFVQESLFHKMMSLIYLLGAKGRGKDGIQWRTVSLLYTSMQDARQEGNFRYYCLLMLLTISDERQSLYREADDWILKTEIENPPPHGAVPAAESAEGHKLKVKINL